MNKRIVGFLLLAVCISAAYGQTPPSQTERARFTGLFLAAARGDTTQIKGLIAKGARPDQRDTYERTPLHVATYAKQHEAMRTLVTLGADPNALEKDRYDIVTIAAVANDVPTLKVALEIGCSAKNVTSRYDGTALIAAAHMGHSEVVRTLIQAKAPLDHVNNLGWTAVIESIVLGDGGPRHVETLYTLIEAGANITIADRNGQTPLALARARRYLEMVKLLEKRVSSR